MIPAVLKFATPTLCFNMIIHIVEIVLLLALLFSINEKKYHEKLLEIYYYEGYLFLA